MFQLAGQFEHSGLRFREGLAQFLQFRKNRFGQRGFHLCRRQPVMANEKQHVSQVLGVIATHHLGEDQVKGGWTKQLQPLRGRAGDCDKVLFPVATKEDLVGPEQMREVEALGAKLTVDRFLRLPETVVRRQRIEVAQRHDGVHVLGLRDFQWRGGEAKLQRGAAVENNRTE